MAFDALKKRHKSNKLKKIILKNRAKLDEFGPMLYKDAKLESQNEVLVIPETPIKDIDEFDKILNILGNFRQNGYDISTNVNLKIENNDNEIIGYVVNRNDYRMDYSTQFKFKFNNILSLLELVVYLTENNVSLSNLKYEHLTFDDYNISFLFFYPHLLHITNDLNYMDNIRWFLGIILHMIGINNLNEFKSNFYLSNEMYFLFEKVIFKDEVISLKELYNSFNKYFISNFIVYKNKYPYDSEKYYTSYSDKNVNLDDDFIAYLLKEENIIFRQEKYVISRSNTSDYYLVYTSFDRDSFNSLKANAKLLNTTTFRAIDFKYFIYSRKCSHPIGMCITDTNIKDILENKESLKDVILNKKNNVLIKIIDIIFSLIDDMCANNISFSRKLELSDFVYEFSNREDKVSFGKIFDIIYPTDKYLQLKHRTRNLKLDIALKIIKECTKYSIHKGRVEFEPYSKVLSFSPGFKFLFKKYLLDENDIKSSSFSNRILEALYNNINHYKKQKRTYYYEKYPVNPFYNEILMDIEMDSLEIKDANYEYLPFYKGKLFSYSTFIDKYRNIVKRIKSLSSSIIISDSYKFVFSEDIFNDTIKVCGIYVKKMDSLYRFSYDSICELYQKGKISNKDIIDLIHEILNLSRKINVDYLYFNDKLKAVIPESRIFFSIGIQSPILFDFIHIKNPQKTTLYNDLLKIIEVDSVFEADNLYESLDTKCTHHNFWYNHEECCSICYPNSLVIDNSLIGEVVRKTTDITVYSIIKNDKHLFLKVLSKNGDVDIESIIKSYKQRYDKYTKYITREKGDKVGGFFKRALDKDLNTIGFVTKFISGSRKITSSYFDVKNRLDCISNLIYFLQKLSKYNFTLRKDNFKDIIEFTEDFLPLIIDPETNLYEDETKSILQDKSITDFIKNVLLSSNIKGLTEEYVENIIKLLVSSDFDTVANKIQNAKDGLDSYCPKHKLYYSLKSHECCCKCYDESIKGYSLNEVENSNLLSDIGKESKVYELKGKLIGKVYRTDEEGNFENELDINKKEEEIKSLIAKKDLLEYVGNPNNYELVLITGVIIDENGNFRGVVTNKIENCKSIKVLTDKAKIEEYNITRTDVFKILIHIGHAIEFCHNHKVYIGDLSYNNILFDLDTKKVFIIDFDSVNLKEGDNTVFTDHFVDPKAISKDGYAKCSKGADLYAFAILAFYLLTLLHPFNGVYFDEETNQKLTIPQRKVRKISVLGDHGVKIPPIALDWDFMTPELINAFLDIFEHDKRYNITKFLEDNLEKLNSLEDFDYSAHILENDNVQNNDNDDKDVDVDSDVENQDNNKKVVTDGLITKFIQRTLRSNEYIASKGVFVKDNNCIRFDALSPIDIGTNIKKVYACSSRMVYFATESNQIGYCKKDHYEFLPFTTYSDIFQIPYTENMIYVSEYNSCKLMLYNASDDSYFHIYSTDTNPIPKFSLSINTRYGNNDVDMIMASFAEVIKLLCKMQSDMISYFANNYIYADLLGGYKYLIIAFNDTKTISSCYVYDYKNNDKSKMDIPDIFLSKNNLNNFIFINNAIYYPDDGKICSLNLINKKYVEFMCDKVNEDSKIEVINGGFRINNGDEMFELTKNK